MNVCLNCGKEFSGKKGSKFDSGACRTAYSRKKVSVTESVTQRVNEDGSVTDNVTVRTEATFTPNYKKLGLKNKDEALKFALAALYENRHSIISKGIDGTATFIIGGKTKVLTSKGFEDPK